jgi:hypothetical protein
MEEPEASTAPAAVAEPPEPGDSSSKEEDVEWMKYEPPEALNDLAKIRSEAIIAIVQSSLENVQQQVAAEKERAEREAEALERQAEALRRQAEAEAETAQGKGKGKETATEEPEEADASRPPMPTIIEPIPGPSRPQRRSRFGISRMLRHVIMEKGESSTARAAAGHRHSPSAGSIEIPPPPSAFTHFVYKHLKSKDATPDSGSETV